jgi:hypothetical protein
MYKTDHTLITAEPFIFFFTFQHRPAFSTCLRYPISC